MGNSTSDKFMAALLNLLESSAIKQVDIAEASGIAAQTISGIVNGRKAPGLASQEKIANACGFSYLEFIKRGEMVMQGGNVQNVAGIGNVLSQRGKTIQCNNGDKLKPEYRVLIDALDRMPEDESRQKIFKFLGELAEKH